MTNVLNKKNWLDELKRQEWLDVLVLEAEELGCRPGEYLSCRRAYYDTPFFKPGPSDQELDEMLELPQEGPSRVVTIATDTRHHKPLNIAEDVALRAAYHSNPCFRPGGVNPPPSSAKPAKAAKAQSKPRSHKKKKAVQVKIGPGKPPTSDALDTGPTQVKGELHGAQASDLIDTESANKPTNIPKVVEYCRIRSRL